MHMLAAVSFTPPTFLSQDWNLQRTADYWSTEWIPSCEILKV